MLDRYSLSEMTAVWSQSNQYQSWLDVEIAVVDAWASIGVVPAEDQRLIHQFASFKEERVAEIEAVTHHDMVAFTRAVSESLGDESKWIHYGMTSTDVVDTAQALRIRQANRILRKDLHALRDVLHNQALTYQNTLMIGRTHGVQAEPTTFGLKMARWMAETDRNIDRFDRVAAALEVGKISGAVGTFANIPPEIETHVMSALGLTAQPIATQVLPRDLHADYISTLALIATSIEEFATEIRSLQRSEIHEVEEGFAPGQKGSSAMPHKRNPISSENLTGLARVIRGHVMTAYEDIPLWHERDISHSSAERIILPDTTGLLDYMLQRFTKLIQNLTVFPERMIANMGMTHGLIYSQQVMLALINHGMTREEAYDLVQPLTAKVWETGADFKPLVEANPTFSATLSSDELDEAFSPKRHLKYVQTIYDRLGIK